MFLVLVLVALLSTTLLIWLLNVFVYVFYDSADIWEPLSPVRCVLALVLPALVVLRGLDKKSLSPSGAYTAFLVGMVVTLSSYGFMAALLTFFFAGSKVTKWRPDRKRKLEDNFKEDYPPATHVADHAVATTFDPRWRPLLTLCAGYATSGWVGLVTGWVTNRKAKHRITSERHLRGERDWIQVLCNGGVATELALVQLINSGCAEHLIDFQQRYTASWLSVAVVSSLAASCGDTFSSEIGSVVGPWSPRLITTWRRVPKGTNGAVSLVGTLASALGGLIVGLTYSVVMATVCQKEITDAPPQWPIIAIATASGLFGSLFDSLLGATVQFSGINVETGCIVEIPGDNVKRISGFPILDNHGVNLLNSAVVAFLAPYLGFFIWGYYV